MNRLISAAASAFKSFCVAILGLSLIFAIGLLMGAPNAQAQALSGIQGTVTDESGAVVPDANVTGDQVNPAEGG